MSASKRKSDKEKLEKERYEDLRRIREQHPTDLVARARACQISGRVLFADTIDKGGGVVVIKLTEMNLYRIFDAILIGDRIGDLHCDLSRRTIIDEAGEPVDDIWNTRQLFDAVQVFGLNGNLTSDTLIKSLRQWALNNKFNDICERVRVKLDGMEHDGTSRLETYLITTLGLEPSADNRLFSKYWVLSMYNRVMNPGCLAPISMAMFGTQDAGKSHFQRMWCQEILGDKDAAPVTYDPVQKNNDLFRSIYGISIIATIPEMTGFGKADIRKMKALLTDTTDTWDKKFGHPAKWPRQFMFILDSNSYSGLYRDDDDRGLDGKSLGERRWFPVFVGQVPGATGEVRWNETFRVAFGDVFVGQLWQVMKEADAWMAEHGMNGYIDLVHETTAMVRRFSRDEKNAGHGVVKDETFDDQTPFVLYRALKSEGYIGSIKANGEEAKTKGLVITNAAIVNAYYDVTKNKIASQRVSKKMGLLTKVKVGRITGNGMNVSAFVFCDPKFGKFADGISDIEQALEVFWEMYMDGFNRDMATSGKSMGGNTF